MRSVSTRGSYCSVAGVLDRLVLTTKRRAQVNSYIGTLRGLETFSQLAQHASAAPALLQVPAYVRLRDSPSFKHRGVLLDTARN